MLAGDAEVDIRTQEALVTMAKAVASATAALVTNARNVAAKCDDQALQNQVSQWSGYITLHSVSAAGYRGSQADCSGYSGTHCMY